MDRHFDALIVGGGHAGVEASHACAALGLSTCLVTLNPKMIGNMPCNPHIGGSAKGIVVREVDALGGLMGKAADHHPLQMKMLNTAKGPGVQCLRSQQDKRGYPEYIQYLLVNTPNLTILKGEAKRLLAEGNSVIGVELASGERVFARKTILTCGTYLDSKVIRGKECIDQGPDGGSASHGLTESLNSLGVKTFRLKTGTPPRLDKKTIDFSQGEIELGSDDPLRFSFSTTRFTPLKDQLPCYLIYTSPKTIEIIKDNLRESALFNGLITSNGPRYCPSIESKVVRFADKPRHQLFLEPEFEHGDSIYLQGFSTGMPRELQEEMVHSLPGLERAKILKYAYQIEYDALQSFQFDSTLKVKSLENLYVAGQICGTSGYEEAAGLGLLSGINAANSLLGRKPLILTRDNSYIGVMVDDLVTKGADEPYRLLTSRAEHRLLLRHDNADERLIGIGHEIGLVDDETFAKFKRKHDRIAQAKRILSTQIIPDKKGLNDYFQEQGYPRTEAGYKGAEVLRRPRFELSRLIKLIPDLEAMDLDFDERLSIQTEVKYEGYIAKEEKMVEHSRAKEGMAIPEGVDYIHMDGLRLEARDKLSKVRPLTIGEASRISGVNPADIAILLMHLSRRD